MTEAQQTALDEADFFTVTDLKQFAYCPRVIYYERCLPGIRPRTFKMDAGHAVHKEEGEKSRRRVTASYGIVQGERLFEVRFRSERLGLMGVLDELIVGTDGARIPVDYKMARAVSANHRVQIAAYAMLIEETWNVPVPRGYIYLIPKRSPVEILMTPRLRQSVRESLDALRNLVQREAVPPPPAKRAVCAGCEFRRFCNDV